MTTLKRESKLWHIGHEGNKYICGSLEMAMMKMQDIANKKQTQKDENMANADYPLGGSLEPYDIWRDDQLTNNNI